VTDVLKEDIIFVDDVCVPTILRLRHESWELAVRRCEPLPSHCHHHMAHQSGVAVDFKAYRFHCKISKNENLFKEIMKSKFSTDEEGTNLLGFGGLGPVKGKICRQWEWLSMEEACQRKVAGLIPPQDGFHVIRETEHISGILLGIEGSSPGKESFFGGKHTVTAKSQELSAFGKRKWSDYRRGGEAVPADLGGMRVTVDDKKFRMLKEVCQRIDLCKPSAGYSPDQRPEKAFFQDLLSSSDAGLGDLFSGQFQFAKVATMGMTGTAVLGDNVVAREDLA